ncbi:MULTISPECIES: bifunctional pyr operon transcriptional regulator/uracil phosphoribosyltransferase PyrR [Thermodesulfovibrio]|uniref:Bifunctional protein PyrR n=2 Tax=Thermodesulfovibrio yellowstonii TaxID=28262 RepID=B5YLD9_THEYD|nr:MULTISPECIES: bifunctional pyr operon transcriptional regulator/uracil phosphoribosyltransferase PyrR [Thermodesulfovibrio]ACI21881.1 PyrR bifunctional protein [Thermodesulfovibrio yellowstonii DSM 11347]MDI6864867.1 bifunctional pyr operon transcriptional regulator/uracil phosphoribosyltransferase PyrR [Thermodesulfovibrio yellowstonii]GLI53378.1 bifunctional protein PyrR [Thermodesulfovibrio islandicus]
MEKELLNEQEIERILNRITHEILERNKGAENICLIGIVTGGVYLAERIKKKIEQIESMNVPLGSLDISFYRDDINLSKKRKAIKPTHIPFSIDEKKVILVDDVLYTGRSTRAAMDALMDFGRPAEIQLAVLIDRGHRELPIMANYTGKYIPTSRNEKIKVYLKEIKGKDSVVLITQ